MIATLPRGPLDIVGDVHGEYHALGHVLAAAGYDGACGHPVGRHLVLPCDRMDVLDLALVSCAPAAPVYSGPSKRIPNSCASRSGPAHHVLPGRSTG